MLRNFSHVLDSLHSIAQKRLLFAPRCSSSLTVLSPHTAPIKLRPYQEDCIKACLEALNVADSTRIGVSLPTGSGKTAVFISLISMLQPPEQSPDANRALIIVNSVELAQQSADQVKRMFSDLSVEIDQGARFKATGQADITVATYQSLISESRLAKFDPSKLKCIIVDEAHHAVAPSYRKILSQFDADIHHPDDDVAPPTLPHAIPIIGFSATFSRHDRLALSTVFQRIVYHRDFLQMIKEKWLCNVLFTSVKAELNLSEVSINADSGDFSSTSLAESINTEAVNKLVVQSWLEKASTRCSTVVFCVNVQHLQELTKAFQEAGVDARYVHSGTPSGERAEIIKAFKASAFPVLLNVAILSEGTDIPNIDCVMLAKPTCSQNVFAQMIGRGMRLSPHTGKVDCHLIDFVDSVSRVDGIVSIPTLFGFDPDEPIDGNSLEYLEWRASHVGNRDGPGTFSREPSGPLSLTYEEYDNPFDLVHDGSGAPHLTEISKFAWVGCGDDVYVLRIGFEKGYIKIVRVENDDNELIFRAHHKEPYNGMSATKPRLVLEAKDLEVVVRGCDRFVRDDLLSATELKNVLRTASWRKEPASETQKGYLLRQLDKAIQNSMLSCKLDVESLNKGQAASINVRLYHGAHTRYAKKMKQGSKSAGREGRRNARGNAADESLSRLTHSQLEWLEL